MSKCSLANKIFQNMSERRERGKRKDRDPWWWNLRGDIQDRYVLIRMRGVGAGAEGGQERMQPTQALIRIRERGPSFVEA